jgi:hypothetical protein
MAFRLRPTVLTTADQDIYVVPAATEGSAHGLTFGNATGSARTVTLKVFDSSAGVTMTLVSNRAIPANDAWRFPGPLNLEPGDKIIASADANSAITVLASIFVDTATPVASGFTPRGPHSNTANYFANDIVESGGVSYVTPIAISGIAPPSAPWIVFADRGPAGSSSFSATWGSATTVASAATTDIGAASTYRVIVTGTTAITSLGTATDGIIRQVRFTGVLTLTHNASTLICLGGANITTADGDVAIFVSQGGGAWRMLDYSRASGRAVVDSSVQTIVLPAGAWKRRTTGGAGTRAVETATNRVNLDPITFSGSVQEFAQIPFAAPKAWDRGTFSFKVIWLHPATTTNFGVVWGMSARVFGDNSALEAAFGTVVTVTDTGGTTDNIYHTAWSAPFTPAGTPAEGDMIMLQLQRNPADAADTMTVAAGMAIVLVTYTATASTDA